MDGESNHPPPPNALVALIVVSLVLAILGCAALLVLGGR